MPCAVIKRTTRHLVTTESDAAAAPSATVADAAVVSSRTEAEGVVAEKQLEPTLPSTKRQRLERIIQYTFKDDDYFQASIHHDLKLGHHLVERVQLQLAIIGDSLIKMIWYAEVFPFPDPRKLNRRWTLIASNKALARVVRDLNLVFLLETEPSDCGGKVTRRASEHALGTLVEAIVGAVYLDSGHNYTATRDVVERLTLLNPPTSDRPSKEPSPPPQLPVVKAEPANLQRRRSRGQKRRAQFRRPFKRQKLAATSRETTVATHDPLTVTRASNLYAQFHV